MKRLAWLLPLLTAALIVAPLALQELTATAQSSSEDGRSSSPPPQRGTVWTVHTTVEAVVDENYAIVNVIADIGNRGPDPEFPFQVRVPDTAFVTGLTIERDGVVHEARIDERSAARAEYDEHKAAQQTGGLVEKARGSSVYAYLINVAEFTSVRATLTYEQYLPADRGLHELDLEAPVSGFGEDLGARFDVLVRHSDTVASAWGTPDARVTQQSEGTRLVHEVGPRPDDAPTPFTATYALGASRHEGSLVTTIHNGTGYFAHAFRAPDTAEDMPLDIAVVLDVSGSMSGLKMTQMQDAARQLVASLDESDRLHLVFFSSAATMPWREPAFADAALKQRAIAAIDEAIAAGGTNIEDGIRTGFGALDVIDAAQSDGRVPVLVFLTDGQPSAGEMDRQRLRQIARDANVQGAAAFSVAFGSDADWTFVSQLARDADGLALRVPEGDGAEVDLRRFLTTLAAPVLHEARLDYDGNVSAHRRSADILFAGSELLVVGTFDPALETLRGTLTARDPGGLRETDFSETIGQRSASFLPRLVAYHDILRYQDLIAADGEQQEWADAITRLALEHGFVTDYTSLVLTLEPRATTPRDDWREEDSWDASDSGGPAVVMNMRGTTAADATGGPAPTAPTPATGGPAFEHADGAAPAEPAGMPGLGLVGALAALAGAALVLRSRRG